MVICVATEITHPQDEQCLPDQLNAMNHQLRGLDALYFPLNLYHLPLTLMAVAIAYHLHIYVYTSLERSHF